MNNDVVDILNRISDMSGESLAEKILDYCETYDIDPQELGDVLEESEDFRNMLYRDCVKHNIIKDEDLEVFMEKSETITPW